jgi:hypothetical protein
VLSQQAFGEIVYRIPNAEETNCKNSDEYQYDIPGMNTDGIGIYDKGTL